MQDDPFNDETIAIGVAHIARYIPKPTPPYPLSAAGRERFSAAGLHLLEARFSEIGTGPVAGGRLILGEPTIADAVFDALALTGPGDLAIATCYTSFGQLNAMTTGGKDIMIDPFSGLVQVVESPVENTLFLQMDIATQIASAADEIREAEQPIDLGGQDLHSSLAAALGPLKDGECYLSTLGPDDPGRYDAGTFQIGALADYLLDLHTNDRLKTNVLKSQDVLPPGEAWGDDWGD